MRVTLLGEEVGTPTSGPSRFLINLVAGLRGEGVDVSVAATSIRPEVDSAFRRMGVQVAAIRRRPERMIAKAFQLTTRSRVGRDVARLATSQLPADWYVVVSDAAVDASASLPPERSVYLSNGDLALMLLSQAFYTSHPMAKSFVARGTSRLILRNAAFARQYKVLLANSEFTRGLMSFLYATPFSGVVYPPVDLNFFRPTATEGRSGNYVLAVARNSDEQGIPILTELAAKVPLHVAGGASVPGAQNLGVIPEDALRAEYCGASFLLFPVASELFGYAVAEALACGTPVMAYRSGGPAEQIQDGQTGWLVRTGREAVARSLSVFHEGVSSQMRLAARRSAERFSIASSAKALLSSLV